ncbi:MAG: LamG-like jellyroll fold domain-containing protein [Planctomycetota bacterium]
MIEQLIAEDNDDGEDHIAYPGQTDDGAEGLGSSDLEMPWEDGIRSSSYQVIGLRFTDLQIPKGSEVVNAYVQFTGDDDDNDKLTGGPVNLVIDGLLQSDPDEFSDDEDFYTDRVPKTNTEVAWSNIQSWTNNRPTGASRTPDISGIIQEIIDQDDWAGGDALIIFIRDDETNPSEGQRSALSGPGAAGPLLHIELSSNHATQPTPADGAYRNNTWVSLVWTPGDTAVSHNVYVDDDYKNLNDRAEDAFLGNQAEKYLIIGYPGYLFPDGLASGTTYYWCIDEVDADGVTIFEGPIWSFTIASKTAYDPVPSHGRKYEVLNTRLNWTAGLGATAHYVYFGTSYNDVNDAGGASSRKSTTYNPGPLAEDTAYFWRVDEFDGTDIYKGDVWAFRTKPEISITDPDLVGFWKFDEGHGSTSLDFSGYGNHAALGGSPEWVEGIVNSALHLGGSDYVVIDGVDDDITTTNITLNAWIKTSQTSEGNIFACNDSASAHPLTFGINDGNPFVHDTGTDKQFPKAINDNQWHMLTFVRNGSAGYVYVDAVRAGIYEPDFTLETITRWSIGQEWDGTTPSDFYAGMVDEVRIYNKALMSAEIAELLSGDPLIAWNPGPRNNSIIDAEEAKQPLSFLPGKGAAQHDVYFGTDKGFIETVDRSDTSGVYRGRQTTTSYDPAENLAWGTGPYYWRVDEHNPETKLSAGSIWSFTVADYLIVDDFEDYDSEINQIWFAWHDGLGYGSPTIPPFYPGNGTGSAVGDENTGSYAEEIIVHGGNQSMPLFYDNNKQGYSRYSETEMTLSATRDWTQYDVSELSIWFRGYPASVGSFVEGPAGTYTMTGSGTDIWDQADEFHFAYKKLTGAGSIVTKVESITNTHSRAKAGVMIRDSLEPDSQYAFACVTPERGISFQYRYNVDTDSDSADQSDITSPHWIKLERSLFGNFWAYHSTDGSTWLPIANSLQQYIRMNADAYIGLALTSHDNAQTCQAIFSNVRIEGKVGPAWTNRDIGINCNAAEPLYVAVSNTTGPAAVVVHENPAAAQIDTWTEWVIPLQVFAEQSIDLTDVDRLAIGLGTRGNIAIPGGSGKMFIDDIGLHRTRTARQ